MARDVSHLSPEEIDADLLHARQQYDKQERIERSQDIAPVGARLEKFFRDLKRSERKAANPGRFEKYEAVIQSPEWRQIRKWILFRAKNRCEFCHSGGELDVHHLTYARLGHERMDDLKALCRNCHDKAHDKTGLRREMG